MKKAKEILEIVACLLVHAGKILIAQREAKDSYGLLWEFPGGRVERGESHWQALKREIKEELNIEIEVGEPLGVFFDENEEIRIKVHLYRCFLKGGKIEARECASFRFITPKELSAVDFAPLDVKIRRFIQSGKIVL